MLEFYLSILDTEEQRDLVRSVYEDYYSLMYYAASDIIKDNTSDVEDAVHQTMMKLIENLDLIDIGDKTKTKNLCCVIAKNKAKDILKRKYNQDLPLDEDTITVSEDEIFEPVFSDETINKVVRSISELSDKYRSVLLLRYINNCKESEIARLLDLNANTVSTRIQRGRRILMEKLREVGIHE